MMMGKEVQFEGWSSCISIDFWNRFADLKLDTLRLDHNPIPIRGFFAPCNHPKTSSTLQLRFDSLPQNLDGVDNFSTNPVAGGNQCTVPGTLYSANTIESFHSIDKKALLANEMQKIWDDICTGRAEEEVTSLNRFFVLLYPDLKKWRFSYWFAFPGVVSQSPVLEITPFRPVAQVLNAEEASRVLAALQQLRTSLQYARLCFFLLHFGQTDIVTLRPLKDWEQCQQEGGKVILSFYDPCISSIRPGWPLRNLLALAAARWGLREVQVLCYRENKGRPNLQHSLIGNIGFMGEPVLANGEKVPVAMGWELNKQKEEPRDVDLAEALDPSRLALSSADLNLKLMRWRLLPSLDLALLGRTKCLVLGVGALGCQLARLLVAWGVRHITLLDHGHVTSSNSVHQSLYTYDDCGKYKAEVAAERLRQILPGLEAKGVQSYIPVHGQSSMESEAVNMRQDCMVLKNLVDKHDVIFLTTDTEGSRWLPTLFCANANKIAVTAAANNDHFIVMRHGSGPIENHASIKKDLEIPEAKETKTPRLGCYFCQSTVMRTKLENECDANESGMGLRVATATLASAYAVELAINILHHPLGSSAPTDSADEYFGTSPHQIYGSLSPFSLSLGVGLASTSCIACSPFAVSKYHEKGATFLLETLIQSRDSAGNHSDPSLAGKLQSLNLKGDEVGGKEAIANYTKSLATTKCLLLGAGTLGCQVARALLAWGVRCITFVDSGRVAMSNPPRQSLYTYEDCLKGGKYKAEAAAESLRKILPGVEARGVNLSIPMPGHTVLEREVQGVTDSCELLTELVARHDLVFLLTDTRESRWLPTLLCAHFKKVAITAALGFSDYLAMRHGAGPAIQGLGQPGTVEIQGSRLGCYFCQDVVAPKNSTRDRTLDQQCTVSRPGVAPIASILAAKLAMDIVHHPLGVFAPADKGAAVSDPSHVVIPYQIRGGLSEFSQFLLTGNAFDSCTACSSFVISEYEKRGTKFLIDVFNDPLYLQDITGLDHLMKATDTCLVEWDEDEAEEGFDL